MGAELWPCGVLETLWKIQTHAPGLSPSVRALRASSHPRNVAFPPMEAQTAVPLTLGLEVQDDGGVHRRHGQGQRAVSQLHVQAHQPQVVLPVQGPHGLGKGGSSCSQQISQQEPLSAGLLQTPLEEHGQSSS